MTTLFADSYYYLAFLNEKDEGHRKAVHFAKSFRGRSITTEWILTEVGDAFVQPKQRSAYLQLLHDIQNDPHTIIIEASHELFTRGVELFADRSDKQWSLTDCISFVVMEEHVVLEALTADRHFEQAGYVPLLI